MAGDNNVCVKVWGLSSFTWIHPLISIYSLNANNATEPFKLFCLVLTFLRWILWEKKDRNSKWSTLIEHLFNLYVLQCAFQVFHIHPFTPTHIVLDIKDIVKMTLLYHIPLNIVKAVRDLLSCPSSWGFNLYLKPPPMWLQLFLNLQVKEYT